MKKIIFVAGFTIFYSCKENSNENNSENSIFSSNETVKCDDKDVITTVISILYEKDGQIPIDYFDTGNVRYIGDKSFITQTSINNILTVNLNKELNSCNCEGSLYYKNPTKDGIDANGSIKYLAQKNSQGEIIVKVEDIGVMSLVEKK